MTRLFFTIALAAAATATLQTVAQLTPRAPLALSPSAAGDSAKYTLLMDYNVSNDSAQPASAPQDVVFTLVDQAHMRVTAGSGATAETAVLDRGRDGRIHAKLKRGSLVYWPMMIFNKLQSVTDVASSTEPGEVRSGAIPLSESEDTIPGSLRVSSAANASTQVAIEAAGPATPREVPKGANEGTPLAPLDQAKGAISGDPGTSQKPKAPGPLTGDATLRFRAVYVGGTLTGAESLERITISGVPAITMTRHWTFTKS